MPVVSVRTACDEGRTTVTLAQAPLASSMAPGTTWEIPVCLKRAVGGKPQAAACELLSGATSAARLDGCSSWVFANANGLGYYRTAYEPETLTALGTALHEGGLTPVEQSSLVADVWALVRLNRQDISDFLTLTRQLAGGPPTPALADAAGDIDAISTRVVDAPARPSFERWVRDTFTPIASRLGPDPTAADSDESRAIRSAVLYTLGYAGRDPGTLAQARRAVERHLADGSALPPSLVSTDLQLAAMTGDAALYDRYMERLKGAGRSDQAQYRAALSYFTDPALAGRTFQYALSPEVRSQDVATLVGGLLARPWSARAAWEDVKRHWDELGRTLDIFQGLQAVVGSLGGFCDQPMRDDIEQFFREHPVPGIDRTLRRTLESVDRCVQMRTRQGQSLSAAVR